MSIVVRYQLVGLTRETYDQATRELDRAGVVWPPDGLQLHVLFGTEGELKVSEIWQSPEQHRAFVDQAMPVFHEVGVQQVGEPEIFEVHELDLPQTTA